MIFENISRHIENMPIKQIVYFSSDEELAIARDELLVWSCQSIRLRERTVQRAMGEQVTKLDESIEDMCQKYKDETTSDTTLTSELMTPLEAETFYTRSFKLSQLIFNYHMYGKCEPNLAAEFNNEIADMYNKLVSKERLMLTSLYQCKPRRLEYWLLCINMTGEFLIAITQIKRFIKNSGLAILMTNMILSSCLQHYSPLIAKYIDEENVLEFIGTECSNICDRVYQFMIQSCTPLSSQVKHNNPSLQIVYNKADNQFTVPGKLELSAEMQAMLY